MTDKNLRVREIIVRELQNVSRSAHRAKISPQFRQAPVDVLRIAPDRRRAMEGSVAPVFY